MQGIFKTEWVLKMQFTDLKYSIESLADHHGWEKAMDGQYFFRYVKEKLKVDVYYNAKIEKGLYPMYLLRCQLHRPMQPFESKPNIDLKKLENIFMTFK